MTSWLSIEGVGGLILFSIVGYLVSEFCFQMSLQFNSFACAVFMWVLQSKVNMECELYSVYYLVSNLETDSFFSYISPLRLMVYISYGDISTPFGRCHKFSNFITIEKVDENKVI